MCATGCSLPSSQPYHMAVDSEYFATSVGHLQRCLVDAACFSQACTCTAAGSVPLCSKAHRTGATRDEWDAAVAPFHRKEPEQLPAPLPGCCSICAGSTAPGAAAVASSQLLRASLPKGMLERQSNVQDCNPNRARLQHLLSLLMRKSMKRCRRAGPLPVMKLLCEKTMTHMPAWQGKFSPDETMIHVERLLTKT